MSKATKDAMDALHGALANVFKDILENGEQVVDKESGEVVRVKPGASMLNAARQFLKDNGIEADAANNPGLQGVNRAILPFPTQADEHGLPVKN